MKLLFGTKFTVMSTFALHVNFEALAPPPNSYRKEVPKELLDNFPPAVRIKNQVLLTLLLSRKARIKLRNWPI